MVIDTIIEFSILFFALYGMVEVVKGFLKFLVPEKPRRCIVCEKIKNHTHKVYGSICPHCIRNAEALGLLDTSQS